MFVVGIGQRVPSVATYKARTQEWLQDAAFWSDMNAYVSDWSQEVYGDVRSYAAPGAPLANRRDALVEFLRHQDLLASAGGAVSGTANAFFDNAGSALANAAWQWGSAYGWTLVDQTLMQQYVSAQVYALRNQGARTGRATDRFGFAWAPKNSDALAPNDFTRQTAAVLDRLAAAIRDSGDDTPSDPGIGACGAAAQGNWCAGDLSGATLTTGWRTFRSWSPTTLAFVSPPQTIAAGVVSGPISLQVQIAGVAGRPAAPVAATIASSSPTGTLSTSAAGPFTPTIGLALPAGAFSTVQLYYQDPTAGAATLTASGAGVAAGTQQLTVGGAAPVALRVEPPASTLFTGGTVTLSAVGIDAFGNATPTAALWTASPEGVGTLSTPSGATTTFTAGTTPGVAQVTATITTPHRHAYRDLVGDRDPAARRPRRRRALRRREEAAPRLRHGRRHGRPEGQGCLGDRGALPERQGLRPRCRNDVRGEHDLRQAGVDWRIPYEGHAGPRREPDLGRRDPGQRVRQEAGREAREEACAPEAVARVASRACLTAQRASPSVVSVRSSPDPVDDSAGTTVIRREYRSACR